MKAHLNAENGFGENGNGFVPQRGSILIHVHADASNPRDAKIIDYPNSLRSVGGCAFVGTVAKVDEQIRRFKEGDRVLVVNFDADARNQTKDASTKLARAGENNTCHIPESFSFTQACSIGLSIATAGLVLFQTIGLELSSQDGKGEVVLVSGGATAPGAMATQLLEMAGYTPIVACSPDDNALCESYGAAACFDHGSPTCGADIRVHTDNNLKYVLDCVTDAATMKMCYEAIGSSGGSYMALDATSTLVKYTRRDVRADWFLAGTTIGDMTEIYGDPLPAGEKQFRRQLFAVAKNWLHDGSIKRSPL